MGFRNERDKRFDTELNVNSVSYEINGEAVPGGDVKQSGSAQLAKIAEDGKRWIATIPLMNLPVRVTEIKATVKAGSLTKEVIEISNISMSTGHKEKEDLNEAYKNYKKTR